MRIKSLDDGEEYDVEFSEVNNPKSPFFLIPQNHEGTFIDRELILGLNPIV